MRNRDELPRREPEPQSTRQSPAAGHAGAYRKRNRPMRRLIPLLVLAAIAVMIARREIPAVETWWEKTFAAEQWALKETCRQAVMEAADGGRYLRIVRGGELHQTGDGPYIDGVTTVQLSDAGVELTVVYTCYLDRQGKLFRLSRHEPTGHDANTPTTEAR